MSEPKLISPLLAEHLMGDPISSHHGVRCCPAIHKVTGDKFIVKIISIPASQVQLEALLLTRAYPSKDAALAYFKELADAAVEEAKILRKLSTIEGFADLVDWQIVPMDDGVGYDVYLLGAYRPTLERFFKTKPITHLAAVNLGLDLCAALSVCRRNGYLYVDLKPSNVILTANQEYRISDLGFVNLSSLKYASLPDRYRSEYTAPEITDAYSALNTTLDVFSAGLILYQAYNDGQLPNMDRFPEEPFPAPAYADYDMAQIILKACAIHPLDRWEDPAQMGQALVSYMQCNSVNDVPIVPQPESEPESIVHEEPSEEVVTAEEIVEAAPGAAEPAESEAVEEAEAESVISEETVAESEAVAEECNEEAVSAAEETVEAEEPVAKIADENASVEEPVPQEIPCEETPVDETVSEEVSSYEPPAEEASVEEDHDEEPVADAEDTVAVADPELPENELEETIPEQEEASISDDSIPEEQEIETEEAVDEAQDAQVIMAEFQEGTEDCSDTLLEGLEDAALTDEVSAMLAQADELIAHKTPDPVVAPEPIDVPIPAPILPEQQEIEDTDEPVSPDAAQEIIPETELGEDLTVADEPIPEEDLGYVHDPSYPYQEQPKKKRGGLITALIVILLTLLLAVGAFFYYENYYLQLVSKINLSGDDDYLTVTLVTDIDDELLTVYCTDAYGNKFRSPVKNGTANFTGLNPGTNYKVTLEISGFHQLIGSTTATYTTDPQTTIVSFSAITGDQDGSVILNFSVQGQENTAWRVRYSTPGEAEKFVDCTGHVANITGLTVGCVYTFRLEPVADLYVVGNHTLEYTATSVIYAENLTFQGYHGGALVVTWDTPAGQTVNSWTVRCYNNDGYDATFTVTENEISIEGLDMTQTYTVDVKADGMTASQWIGITANSITFKDILLDDSIPGQLIITWNAEGALPKDGWHLLYTINGGDKNVIHCDTNSCVITPLLPGAQYDISFELPADVTVLGGTATYTVADKGSFHSYGVKAEDFLMRMCWTPSKANWRWYDLYETNFTNQFAVGEKASFILRMKRFNTSNDEIKTLFVVRDAEGKLISITTGKTYVWTDMWTTYNGYHGAEFDIPVMPQVAGNYTVDIYFNGAWAATQAFTVY